MRQLLRVRRLNELLVLGAALGLSMMVATALAGFAWYEHGEMLDEAQDRGELLARVLEDQVTRSVDGASLALGALSDSIAQQRDLRSPQVQALLSQSLQSLPFVRSIAVLDEQSRVLASSLVAEQGLQLSVTLLGEPPEPGRDRLLPLRAGRSLRELSGQRASPSARGVYMLPLVRSFPGAEGRRLRLLAVINPDALAAFQDGAMGDLKGAVLLGSYGGELLCASSALPMEPGSSLLTHPVFHQWLPAREHGSYVGVGAMPGAQVVAFRVSRSRPLVLIVEQDRTAALSRWRAGLSGLAIAGGVALLLIAMAAVVLLRSLRAREAARQALDRAYAQVAERERELSVLMQSVQELIFRTDRLGVISFANAHWSALCAQPAEGLRLTALVKPEDRPAVTALFAAADAGRVRHATVTLDAPRGPRRLDIAVVPLIESGQLVGFAGSAVDVSERYSAELRLQQQLAFTEQLQEISPLPVAMYDGNGRYLLVNKAWEAFSGRSRAELLGSPAGLSMDSQTLALHRRQDEALLASGRRLSYETQQRDAQGRLRDLVITKVLVPDGQGGLIGVLCTLMDVSEFRAAERATREARDGAEEASRVKSEFIANISHELRTPLQSILGFSELGLSRSKEAPRLSTMFGDIHAAGQRMLALVNDLLDVSKIESAVGTFELERCDLRLLLKETLQELQPLLARKQLRSSLSLPEQAMSCRADPLRMRQVLRNVLANAIKFSPEGALIEASGEHAPSGELLISVADQGPGVPEGELKSIFEAFVQSSATKDGSGGTGLGLAICRKIVEIHGGRIWAENRRLRAGTVFHIGLPPKVWGDTQFDESLA